MPTPYNNQKGLEPLMNGTVIVIEPTDNYRITLQRYLSNLKVKAVKFCNSLAAAKTELALTKASLLIVEWQQQEGQNGLQFCREIRRDKRLREIPFMLLSVESLRGDVVLASEVGIDGYVVKPFSYEEFCDQVILSLKKAQERCRFTALIETADDLVKDGKLKEAEDIYIQCEHHAALSARGLCGVGNTRLLSGNPEDAIACYLRAIETNPTYIEAYRLILDIYENKELPHHVLHYGLKAHELSPENPRYMLMVAKAYLQIGDLTSSEQFFRKTIRVSPSLAEGHKGLGDVHLLNEDYEQAMRCFQKALDLDHDDVSILNSIGLVYIKQNKYDEGIKQYQIALHVDPQNAKVLFNLGFAYEKKDDFDNARHFYNQTLIQDPEYDKAQRCLERVSQFSKKYRRAT